MTRYTRLLHDVLHLAQFIAVCSSSILAETLGYAVSFSSPWRGKRRVFERRKPVLMDQLQPSTNSDKLSDFCTPHESLNSVQKTTPAMAAGITDHCWTMQELLSFHVPLPRWAPPKRRGRPSRVLQRLIERWCS